MSVNTIHLATVTEATNKSVPCSKCGTDTMAKSGVCRACHNGYGLPDPKTLTTERIVTYTKSLRAELERRQQEIAAALKGAM